LKKDYKMSNRETIIEMFTKRGQSAYQIHMNCGISIKEVYDVIERCETVRHNHQKAIRKQRELDRAAV